MTLRHVNQIKYQEISNVLLFLRQCIRSAGVIYNNIDNDGYWFLFCYSSVEK